MGDTPLSLIVMANNVLMQTLAVAAVVMIIAAMVGGVLAYRQVPEGHAGVEKDWGAVNGNIADSGAHWKVPVMTSIQNVETRPRTYTMTNNQGEGAMNDADAITVKTINGTSVDIDVTVRYRINSSEADQFVSDWNNENQMEQRLIRPTIRSDLRDEASDIQTTGSDGIYTRDAREELAATARESLAQRFEDEPIVLEEVQIRNIDLPDSIDQTLSEKEQAKQQVEVEQQKIQQEEARKEQRIVQAEADAEEVRISAQADANATRIRGEALDKHPIVLRQQYISALEQGETVYVGAEDSIALTREVEQGTANNTTAP